MDYVQKGRQAEWLFIGVKISPCKVVLVIKYMKVNSKIMNTNDGW